MITSSVSSSLIGAHLFTICLIDKMTRCKNTVEISLQSLWDILLEYFNHNDFNLHVYGMTLWTVGLYWVIGLLYLCVDLFSWPQWVVKYKTHPRVKSPIDLRCLLPIFRVVLLNQLVINLPVSAIGYYLMKYRGNMTSIQVLPTFQRLILEFVVFIVVEEIASYYLHRLLHHRWFYKHFHKMHHNIKAPVAITALYNHPVDHLIINILSGMLGPALVSSHIFSTWLWVTFATIVALSDHSGYRLPFLPSADRHEFHHLKFTENFGVYGVLDHFHGTDRLFQARNNKFTQEQRCINAVER